MYKRPWEFPHSSAWPETTCHKLAKPLLGPKTGGKAENAQATPHTRQQNSACPSTHPLLLSPTLHPSSFLPFLAGLGCCASFPAVPWGLVEGNDGIFHMLGGPVSLTGLHVAVKRVLRAGLGLHIQVDVWWPFAVLLRTSPAPSAARLGRERESTCWHESVPGHSCCQEIFPQGKENSFCHHLSWIQVTSLSDLPCCSWSPFSGVTKICSTGFVPTGVSLH